MDNFESDKFHISIIDWRPELFQLERLTSACVAAQSDRIVASSYIQSMNLGQLKVKTDSSDQSSHQLRAIRTFTLMFKLWTWHKVLFVRCPLRVSDTPPGEFIVASLLMEAFSCSVCYFKASPPLTFASKQMLKITNMDGRLAILRPFQQYFSHIRTRERIIIKGCAEWDPVYG